MNRSELIEHVAGETELSKAAAGRALDAVLGGIQQSLNDGDSVSLVGFGNFSISQRAARVGRNPSNGEPVKIKAKKVPKFAFSPVIKKALA
jgi:DNA-binding protein HU-beta